ncbi:MAG: hypothetical protein RRY96_05685, partial [Ruthenibacterium sp.]
MNHPFEQFHLCFDTSPIAFSIVQMQTDAQGKATDFIFRYLNGAYANLCGQPIGALLDKSLHKVLTP